MKALYVLRMGIYFGKIDACPYPTFEPGDEFFSTNIKQIWILRSICSATCEYVRYCETSNFQLYSLKELGTKKLNAANARRIGMTVILNVGTQFT